MDCFEKIYICQRPSMFFFSENLWQIRSKISPILFVTILYGLLHKFLQRSSRNLAGDSSQNFFNYSFCGFFQKSRLGFSRKIFHSLRKFFQWFLHKIRSPKFLQKFENTLKFSRVSFRNFSRDSFRFFLVTLQMFFFKFLFSFFINSCNF